MLKKHPVYRTDDKARRDHLEPVASTSALPNVQNDSVIEHDTRITNSCYYKTVSSPTEMQDLIAHMVSEFRCDVMLPEIKIRAFIKCCKTVLNHYNSYATGLMKTLITTKKIDLDDRVVELINDCEVTNLFTNLETFDDNLSYFAGKAGCAVPEPKEIVLGRTKFRHTQKSCSKNRPTHIKRSVREVKDVVHYIPLQDTLSLVMRNEQARMMVERETESNGCLNGFKDGKRFRAHEFLAKFPNALRLSLHIDEGEYNNPLGSRKGNQKLTNITIKIQNFEACINSTLERAYLVLMVKSRVLKKYGYEKVLAELINDFKILSSDAGIKINTDTGNDYTLRAVLVNVLGDTLAIHEIFELMPPQSNLFCRMCYISRAAFHTGLYGEHFELKTPESIANDLTSVQNDNLKPKDVGIKKTPSLHLIPYFNIAQNYTFDPMHDLLEGIIGMVLKLILNELVNVRKVITDSAVNKIISSFDYGQPEKRDMPSANFKASILRGKAHKIGQSAAQCWTLLRAFPFMFWKQISSIDNYTRIIALLLKITYYSFSYRLTPEMVEDLNETVKAFYDSFKLCFPLINPINKIHHLAHYKKVIEECGPVAFFSCMQFEAKFKESKGQAKTCNNFRNITFSLTKRLNFKQIKNIAQHNYSTTKTHIISEATVSKEDLEYKFILYKIPSIVQIIKHLTINGTSFKPGFVAKFIICDKFRYGIIQGILKSNEEYLCIIQHLRIIKFCPEVFSYEVNVTDRLFRVFCSKLCTRKAYSLWQFYDKDDENFYVSLKYEDF